MILCMPTVGQKVRVLDGQEWKFKLYSEYRNYGAWEYFSEKSGHRFEMERSGWHCDFEIDGYENYRAYRDEHGEEPPRRHLPVTLPAESVLTIDRIYLRKGAGEFDSLTFILNGAKIPGKKGANARVRFWVKLDDVNSGNLELLPLEEKPATKKAPEHTQWG